jgi:hypothetical protein
MKDLTRIFKGLTDDGDLVIAKATLHGDESCQSYFSITTDSGCAHDDILDAFGHLEEVRLLVALHLSHKDGTPMHAAANASHWINQKDEVRLSKHLRISEEEAEQLMAKIDAESARTNGTRMLIADEMLKQFVEELRPRWKEEAERALRALQEPMYVDGKLAMQEVSFDPNNDIGLRIDDEILTGDVHGNEISVGPSHRYIVFENSEEAGKAAREYWKEMAEYDPKEFTAIVGEDTLVNWALGHSAGPGSTHVRSLDEWLDLSLDCPEEHFASYDGLEVDCEISRALAEELSIDCPKKAKWIKAVAYRA